MAQAILVEMRARIRLEIGALMRFCPNLDETIWEQPGLARFCETHSGQECIVVELHDITPPIPASEIEADDPEAEIFANAQRMEATLHWITVRFADGEEHRAYIGDLVALGASNNNPGECDPSGLRAYSAATEAHVMASIMEARKNLKV